MIRLDEAKFEDPATNKVFIGFPNSQFLEDAAILEPKHSSHKALLREKCDNRGKVRLQGTVSLADTAARKSIRVAKYGARTCLTHGVTNEIKAVIRKPIADGKRLRAWEWIVVALQFGDTHPPFSQPGDSGATVIDFDGRVVGFVSSDFEHGKTVMAEKGVVVEAVPRL